MTDDHMPARPGEESTAYLYLDRSRDITTQVQITESLIVDVDNDGRPVGIESLDGPVNFGALLAIVRGSVLKGHVWPAMVDGAATERPADGAEQGEAAEEDSGPLPEIGAHDGPCVNYEDQDPFYYSMWDSCFRHMSAAERRLRDLTAAEAERDELRQRAEQAEGLLVDIDASNERMANAMVRLHDEREGLRGKVDAVRALCDEAELADPSVVFSQGGPQWSVWTSEVRAALDGTS